MIEYLHNAVRATAGEDIKLAAKIVGADEAPITTACHLNFYNDTSTLGTYDGTLVDGVWEFTIPAEATANLFGRYWYCICDKTHTKYNFKQPIYLV